MIDNKFIDAYSYTLLQTSSLEEAHWFAKHTLKNKLDSKYWLVEELTKLFIPKNVCILGSWYGTIIPYALNNDENTFTCVDIDPSIARLTDVFNNRIYKNNRVKAITADARSFINATSESFDCVINTSCEHMQYDMKDMLWDTKPLYVLQSNNYNIPEHINFKNSLEEFEKSTGLSNILYSGSQRMSKYDRYMVIGKL